MSKLTRDEVRSEEIQAKAIAAVLLPEDRSTLLVLQQIPFGITINVTVFDIPPFSAENPTLVYCAAREQLGSSAELHNCLHSLATQPLTIDDKMYNIWNHLLVVRVMSSKYHSLKTSIKNLKGQYYSRTTYIYE